MEYRLTFDEPYSFATETGLLRSVHCADFNAQAGAHTNTWREPVTGLVMLAPNVITEGYYDAQEPLSSFRVAHGPADVAPSVQNVERSGDNTAMFTNVVPATKDGYWSSLAVNVVLATINQNIARQDDLIWLAETKFMLAQDEGFVVTYHTSADEISQKYNWFGVQWDNIQIQVSHTGLVSVFVHDRSNMMTTPVLVEEFRIGKAGDFINKTGLFGFIPIPGRGLLMSSNPALLKAGFISSSVQAGTTATGHLIAWPSTQTYVGDKIVSSTMFQPTMVRIAVNPSQKHTVGFRHIRYPSTGTYTDAVLDPGYNPSAVPTDVSAFVVPGTVPLTTTAVLRNGSNTGAWTAGTDRQGRVKMTLNASADGKYTPFVEGYGLTWAPVFATRASTPLTLATVSVSGTLDKLMRLEYTTDEWGKWEGTADVLMGSAAAKAIAQRGDASFLLEASNDSGTTWFTVNGGLAKDWDLVAVDETDYPLYYLCKVKLVDFYERFREIHKSFPTSFDNVTPGDAINVVLTSSGFSPISPLPTETTASHIPPVPVGTSWRVAPRNGDNGEDITRLLLLYLWKQYQEWRLRFDWPTYAWVLETKPRDTVNFWTLTSLTSQQDASSRIWAYSAFKPKPEPPECNLLIVAGKTTTDTQGYSVVSAPIYNVDSISNPSSIDYLGRIVEATYEIDNCSDQATVDLFARRLYPTACFHHGKGEIDVPHLQPALVPNTAVRIVDKAGTILQDGWIKRVTIIIEECDSPVNVVFAETMKLSIDSVWEGELIK